MTKQIFFILAVLCTLQAQASVRPIQVDTVQHTPYYDVSAVSYTHLTLPTT